MTLLPSKAIVSTHTPARPIPTARQAHIELYRENIRNGFRFVGYGLQKEDETYGPAGRINGTAGRTGGVVDIYV